MPQRMTVARSIEPKTSRSNTKPMAPITASAASITSAFKNSLASKMTQPRPQSEAASISAPTTAIHARRNAWRSPVMMNGDARPLVGAHGAGRAQPQRIDGPHPRPGIEQHGKERGIEHDEDRDGVAEPEPENE